MQFIANDLKPSKKTAKILMESMHFFIKKSCT